MIKSVASTEAITAEPIPVKLIFFVAESYVKPNVVDNSLLANANTLSPDLTPVTVAAGTTTLTALSVTFKVVPLTFTDSITLTWALAAISDNLVFSAVV